MIDQKFVESFTPSVDWFTFTTNDQRQSEHMFNVYRRHIEDDGPHGYPVPKKPWAGLGFIGEGSPHMKWGYNNKTGYTIMIGSGDVAHKYWFDALPAAKKVTRFDLCVTTLLRSPIAKLADKHYKKLSANGQRKFAHIRNSQGGETLYVGSRQSQNFGRLYDKGVESGIAEPGLCWRYEVELKSPKSTEAARTMWDIVNGCEGAHKAIQGFVWSWFDHRGITPLFPADGGNVMKIQTEAIVSTPEKTLRWLRTQVQPSVRRLFEAGMGRLVLEELGINVTQLAMLLPGEFDKS